MMESDDRGRGGQRGCQPTTLLIFLEVLSLVTSRRKKKKIAKRSRWLAKKRRAIHTALSKSDLSGSIATVHHITAVRTVFRLFTDLQEQPRTDPSGGAQTSPHTPLPATVCTAAVPQLPATSFPFLRPIPQQRECACKQVHAPRGALPYCLKAAQAETQRPGQGFIQVEACVVRWLS